MPGKLLSTFVTLSTSIKVSYHMAQSTVSHDSRFPRNDRPNMTGSMITQNRMSARD